MSSKRTHGRPFLPQLATITLQRRDARSLSPRSPQPTPSHPSEIDARADNYFECQKDVVLISSPLARWLGN